MHKANTHVRMKRVDNYVRMLLAYTPAPLALSVICTEKCMLSNTHALASDSVLLHTSYLYAEPCYPASVSRYCKCVSCLDSYDVTVLY
jgi:hypothetical protein